MQGTLERHLLEVRHPRLTLGVFVTPCLPDLLLSVFGPLLSSEDFFDGYRLHTSPRTLTNAIDLRQAHWFAELDAAAVDLRERVNTDDRPAFLWRRNQLALLGRAVVELHAIEGVLPIEVVELADRDGLDTS